ncbi:hypothetical protein SAMN05216533_4456 [Streptomyces sp. Ag109_O5-10]|nr:hypothetical protein SAMN05216533_4456 [Streptomyces sp. Ag109_O5-10]
MPGHGTPRPLQGLVTKESPLIHLTSLFSAPEAQTRCSTAASPPPSANPFQAPDFGEDETLPLNDTQEPATGTRVTRPDAAWLRD